MKEKVRDKLKPILEHINALNLSKDVDLYCEDDEEGYLVFTELFTDSASILTEEKGLVGVIKDLITFVAEEAGEKQRQMDKRPILELEREARDKAIANGNVDDGAVGAKCFYAAGGYRPTRSEVNNWVYQETGLWGEELGIFEDIPREAYEEVRKMVRAYMDEYRAAHAPKEEQDA